MAKPSYAYANKNANTMRNFIGELFGRLTVKALANKICDRPAWSCQCSCGNQIVVMQQSLLSGNTRSCKCLLKEKVKERVTTHGFSSTPTYHVWEHMIQRCTNPKDKRFKAYGGRGITVCKRWHTFINFLEDMGEKPEHLSIERVNNNKGYSPDNCKWATRKEQNSNTRRNRLITHNKETHTLSEWAAIKNKNYQTLRARLNRSKWPIEMALEEGNCKGINMKKKDTAKKGTKKPMPKGGKKPMSKDSKNKC